MRRLMMVATLLIALSIASVAYAIGAGGAFGVASLPPILGVLAIAGGVAFLIASREARVS
jgi:hypothetical protein